MNTALPALDENPIATLAAAIAIDRTINSAGAGELSRLSVAVMQSLPFDREKSMASRAPTVAIALSDFPPSNKFRPALESAAASHTKARAIALKVRDIFGDKVKEEYHRQHVAASKKLMGGGDDAFVGLEAESDLATRFQTEIDSRQSAMSAFGFQQIEYALVIRDELDTSLSKLIDSLKVKDAANAKRYGVDTDYSAETRLVVSVRILHARATLHLVNLEKASPTGGPYDFQLVRNAWRDFLPEVAAWE